MQVNSTNAAASTAPVRAEPSPPAQLDSVDRSHERVRARLAPNVVDISPAARARVKMTRAGVSGPVEFARTVKAVVGEGEPNAELKARVLGLIVGVLTTRRIEVRRVALEPAERRDGAARQVVRDDHEHVRARVHLLRGRAGEPGGDGGETENDEGKEPHEVAG